MFEMGISLGRINNFTTEVFICYNNNKNTKTESSAVKDLFRQSARIAFIKDRFSLGFECFDAHLRLIDANW